MVRVRPSEESPMLYGRHPEPGETYLVRDPTGGHGRMRFVVLANDVEVVVEGGAEPWCEGYYISEIGLHDIDRTRLYPPSFFDEAELMEEPPT